MEPVCNSTQSPGRSPLRALPKHIPVVKSSLSFSPCTFRTSSFNPCLPSASPWLHSQPENGQETEHGVGLKGTREAGSMKLGRYCAAQVPLPLPPGSGSGSARTTVTALTMAATTPPVVLTRALVTCAVQRHKQQSNASMRPRQPCLWGCIKIMGGATSSRTVISIPEIPSPALNHREYLRGPPEMQPPNSAVPKLHKQRLMLV